MLAIASKEILEKSIPSCTATILMNLLKMSKKEKIMIMATKAYKYYACSQMYYLVANYGMGTNRLINYFKVHKNIYSKFKTRLKLENPILLYKFKLKIPTINSFENERFENAVDLVKDFKEANNDVQTGSLLIRKWIFVNKNKRVSEKMINLIKREKPEVFKNSFNRDNYKKTSYFNESKKHNSYVRNNLIEMNFNTPNVVGVDGTNLKIELNNFYYKTKLNCMISYDCDLKTIVAYNFDKNENSNSSLKVFKRINEYSVNTKSNKVIQSNKGLAFSCEKIFEYINKNNNIVHSMSKRGFKHYASTESLNRWVKEKFFKTYGCEFKNIQNFYDTFRKFVYNFNKLQFLKYNIFDQKKLTFIK
ncbi:hypothetical protein [Spiroplasma apis]|nr:hypothetical protein [Spiroplasma apis]